MEHSQQRSDDLRGWLVDWSGTLCEMVAAVEEASGQIRTGLEQHSERLSRVDQRLDDHAGQLRERIAACLAGLEGLSEQTASLGSDLGTGLNRLVQGVSDVGVAVRESQAHAKQAHEASERRVVELRSRITAELSHMRRVGLGCFVGVGMLQAATLMYLIVTAVR